MTTTQFDNLAIGAIQEVLIDVAELAAQAKQAHWNVRGATFLPVHQWLDGLAGTLRAYTDTLAERVATLGGWPDARSETLSEHTTLKPLSYGALTTGEALTAMDTGLGRVAAVAASRLGDSGLDPVSADLLTGLCRDLQNQQWLARAQQ